MAITEIFARPPVKQVFFEIKYPHLFIIEKNIGEFQQKIISTFPDSALVFRSQVMITSRSSADVTERPEQPEEGPTAKIWQFSTENKEIILSIQSNALAISSTHHKTYDLGEGDKFRGVIQFVMNEFIDFVAIPKISRIGLRYINECPIFSMNTSEFQEYYNSAFPLDKFTLEELTEMLVKATVRKGDYFINYSETLKHVENENILVLDYDSYSFNIPTEDYLVVLDALHENINMEFDMSTTDKFKDFMRSEA